MGRLNALTRSSEYCEDKVVRQVTVCTAAAAAAAAGCGLCAWCRCLARWMRVVSLL